MVNERSVSLGVMPPMSGIAGIYGREIERAARIACAEVNEGGGVLGRPLELLVEDDGSLPESAVAAAERLADRGCAALVGNLLSNARIAVAYRVAEPRHLPYLNFSFYEGGISSRYYFHFAALPNQQIDKMIPCMKSRYGPKMYFAGANYEWPRGSIDAARRALIRAGGQVVEEEYLPLGADREQMRQLMARVAASGADVFVPYFAGSDQINLLTEFSELGLKKRIAVVMGHYDEAMAAHLPPDVREGYYSSNTYYMTVPTEGNRRFLARLAALPGVTGLWPEGDGILTNFGEGAYLCVRAFARAANAAGSLDPERLIRHLERVTVEGPQGEVRMDPTTHHARVNTYLTRCRRDGTFEIVESFGAEEPLIPERYRRLYHSGMAMSENDMRLQARIVEQMTEGVLLVDSRTGRIIFANRAAEELFGYDEALLTSKDYDEVKAGVGGMAGSDQIEGILFRKGVWSGEAPFRRSGGGTFPCLVSITTFTHAVYGEVWLAVHRDITDLVRVRRREEELNRARRYFTTVTSHELRTPLTHLQLAAIFLDDLRASCPDEERLAQVADLVRQSFSRIESVVSATSLLAEMQQPEPHRELSPVPLRIMLDSSIEILRTRMAAARREIAFTVSDTGLGYEAAVLCNPGHVERALLEILNNAVRYTPDGGAIRVEASPTGIHAAVRVIDSGVGMSAEEQAALDDVYYSPRNPNLHYTSELGFLGGGLGLGLCLARSIMEEAGGTLTIESPGHGKGTSATLRFPLVTESGSAPPAPARTVPGVE
ncbi:MAG: ABC transporter substrate-binding protein [Nitrospinae bacterium]|nr:ABC transporter substrate-binding protein [Nitrospinota bacterium]